MKNDIRTHPLLLNNLCPYRISQQGLQPLLHSFASQQVWRMMSHPKSYWVRILKAFLFSRLFYFSIWSSILESRDLIKEQLVWQVIERNKTNTWRDKWNLRCKPICLTVTEKDRAMLPQKSC